jgi:hypothetical protein
MAKSVVISSGVVVEWYVVMLAPVCCNLPASDQWIGGRVAWTASDAEDRGDDTWVLVGELPVWRCPTCCRFEAHRLVAVRR